MAREGIGRREFEARLRQYRKELGEPLEFSAMEETFWVKTYVFNSGWPYLIALQHYHFYPTERDEYSEMFLNADWLEEILKKWGPKSEHEAI
jgi:hypothetical protein